MGAISTAERIRRRMLYYRVPEWIAVDMLTAEAGGDVIETVDGKRIMPAWWREGRAERKRDARRMLRYARQRDTAGNHPT